MIAVHGDEGGKEVGGAGWEEAALAGVEMVGHQAGECGFT